MSTIGAGAPATTVQHALERLRAAIVSGELAPGARIRQEQLAERLGISIAPVREALRALEQEGQVSYLPRRGYSVAVLDAEDLREIYGLRRLLESEAARVALPRLDADAVARIEAAAADCANAIAAGDIAASLAANRRFHLSLLDSGSQPNTLRIIRQLWDSTEAYRGLYYAVGEEARHALDAHDRILAAVHAGDVAALVGELNDHRQQALDVLDGVLSARGLSAG